MEYITPLTYLALVFIHAYYDSKHIKTIDHKAEAAVYIIICALVGVVFVGKIKVISIILFPLLTRAAFFDPLFNWLIGNHFLYEGVYKPKNKRSLFDWLELKIGLPVFIYRIVYFIIYLIHIFYYERFGII